MNSADIFFTSANWKLTLHKGNSLTLHHTQRLLYSLPILFYQVSEGQLSVVNACACDDWSWCLTTYFPKSGSLLVCPLGILVQSNFCGRPCGSLAFLQQQIFQAIHAGAERFRVALTDCIPDQSRGDQLVRFFFSSIYIWLGIQVMFTKSKDYFFASPLRLEAYVWYFIHSFF